jgi:hypothetical protein
MPPASTSVHLGVAQEAMQANHVVAGLLPNLLWTMDPVLLW